MWGANIEEAGAEPERAVRVDEDLLKLTLTSQERVVLGSQARGIRTTWFGISLLILSSSIACVQLPNFSKISFSHL